MAWSIVEDAGSFLLKTEELIPLSIASKRSKCLKNFSLRVIQGSIHVSGTVLAPSHGILMEES